MKKFTLLFILLMTVSLFTGCASLTEEEYLEAIGTGDVEFQSMEYTSVKLFYKKSVNTNKPSLRDGGYIMSYCYIEKNPEDPKFLFCTFECDGTDIGKMLQTYCRILSYNETYDRYDYYFQGLREVYKTVDEAYEKLLILMNNTENFRFNEDFFTFVTYDIKKTSSGYKIKNNIDDKYIVDNNGYIQSYEMFPKKLDSVAGSIRNIVYTYNDPINFNEFISFSDARFNKVSERFKTVDIIEKFKSLNEGHLL